MIQRRIFPALEAHLSERFITVITGMRRVGKSTALHYLLGKIPHQNKVYLDLERVENRFTWEQLTYRDIQIDLEIAGIDFTKPAVIALDEIQLVPAITSAIKWFYDTYPDLKFLVTGSSSFYLKNRFSESLAGRKHIFEMFPLDFLEFLWFRGVDTQVLEQHAFETFHQGIYLKYKDLYEEFQRFGGFPDVVLSDQEQSKIRTIKDVVNAYIELDIRLVADFEISGTLYKLIRLLAGRTGSLIDATKIGGMLGIERRKLIGYLDLLEKTYFIHAVTPFTRNVDREISQRRKLYLADTGILNHLAQVSSGQLFENQVCLQLMKLGETQFFQRKTGFEIDFIQQQTTAYEVKETPHGNDLDTLKSRALKIGLDKQYLIGKHPPGDGFRDFVWGGQVF